MQYATALIPVLGPFDSPPLPDLRLNRVNDTVGPNYPINTFPVSGPSRMQARPPDSRLNHIPDPAVHAMYQKFVNHLA